LIAVAAATGCAAPSTRTAGVLPVGNTRLLPAPDRRACVAALEGEWPAETVGTVDIVVPDPSRGMAACLVQRVVEAEREIVFVVIARDGEIWRARGRLDLTLSETADADREETTSGTSSIALFAISPRESAVRWESVQRTDGHEYGTSITTVTLIRLADDGDATEIFSIESEAQTGEADDIWQRDLTTARTMTDGLYDLEVEVVHRVAEWAAGDQAYTEASETLHYAWDGVAYSPSD
jgi:hypothetical protein